MKAKKRRRGKAPPPLPPPRLKGGGRDKAIDIIIGGNIKRMRAQRGVTQLQLGKKLGITFQQIQKYEKGANSIATCRVPDMLRALDCSLDALFDGALERRNTAFENQEG